VVRRPSGLSRQLDSPDYLGLSNMPLTPTTPLEKRAGTAPEGRIRRAVLRDQCARPQQGVGRILVGHIVPECLSPILKAYHLRSSYDRY